MGFETRKNKYEIDECVDNKAVPMGFETNK